MIGYHVRSPTVQNTVSESQSRCFSIGPVKKVPDMHKLKASQSVHHDSSRAQRNFAGWVAIIIAQRRQQQQQLLPRLLQLLRQL